MSSLSLQPDSAPEPDFVTVESPTRPGKGLLREIIETALLTVIIYAAVNFTTGRFRIESISMLPTFQPGQYVVVDKLSYLLGKPQRGDVIVFQYPLAPDKDYIKRVIGLPGESVEIKSGKVYIHQDRQVLTLEEPYIKAAPNYNFRGGVIPDNHYFVLGDNRNNSNDSHSGWTASREDIIGKAWISIWPPDEWGLAPNYTVTEQTANATK